MATIRFFTLSRVSRVSGLIAGFVLAAALCLVITGEAYAKSKSQGGNPKYASIVMDAQTGAILSQSNPDKKLHPASLTKIMTLLMLFEAIERGETSLNARIPISSHAANMAPSKIGLPVGATIKAKDAIYALVTKSANDIAVAVAEHVGGTESAFARKMTARAHEIGMSGTTFTNASGLHDPRQVSTARDMAKLARFVIVQYPDYYRYFSTANFQFQGRNYHNHNRLMATYRGMDGMKTGFTNPSGFNLVASAVRNNRRLIGVVFGGRTTQSRNSHMAELLDRGFAKSGGGPARDLLIAEREDTSDEFSPAEQTAEQAPTPLPQIASLNARNGKTAPLPLRKPGSPEMNGALLAQAMPAAGNALAAPPAAVQPMALPFQNTPTSKPGQLQVAALQQSDLNTPQDIAEDMAGQGDIDPAVYKRIEAGLSAIAAHQNENKSASRGADLHRVLTAAQQQAPVAAPPQAPGITQASYHPPQRATQGAWSVQIGAFTSRAATDQALQRVLRQIPAPYSQAQPMIAPLKTSSGWLFRARLTGMTKTEALAACNYIRDCLPVAPQN